MAPDDRELSFFMLLRTNSHLYTGVREGGGGVGVYFDRCIAG